MSQDCDIEIHPGNKSETLCQKTQKQKTKSPVNDSNHGTVIPGSTSVI